MHRPEDDRIYERACRGLARRGHDVWLIATMERKTALPDVHFLPLKPRTGWRRRFFSSFEALRKAIGVQADIFVFHDPDLIPWMSLLALMGRRVVYDVHENYLYRLESMPLASPALRVCKVLFRAAEFVLLRPIAGLTVVTNSLGELYRFARKPTIVTYNTVDLERLSELDLNQPKQAEPTIYTSGTNSRSRNCLQTLEAMPLILEQIPDARMVFVGRYHPADFELVLRRRAEELGVAGRVEITGMLPWAENFTRTARMHIGCVFYEDNANNRIGLPNRLFEYMACGVAVLAEDFPEPRRIIDDAKCGEVVDSASPVSIASAAIRLLTDRDDLVRAGCNGRRAIEGSYGFHAELDKLEVFFYQLAGYVSQPVGA